MSTLAHIRPDTIMRIIRRTLSIGIVTMVSFSTAHAQLRSYAGVVAGNAAFGPQFQCSVSGPTIPSPWSTGLRLPLEGMTACKLNGMVDDKTGAVGTLYSSATGSGPMATVGTYTGTANAHADYWNLGVSATGIGTGDASSGTYRQSVAYASFAQDLTFTSPTVANGSNGFTNFSFLIDGFMNNLPVGPYTQQGDIAFSLLVNNQLWTAFLGTTINSTLPYLRGSSTGLPGNFVLTPGAFSGSANFTTVSNFAFTWGNPLHVEIAMYTDISACCYGASIISDFYNTAKLTGVDAYGPGGKVTDFIVNTTSGLQLDTQGVIQVPPPTTTAPEPATIVLTFTGLVVIGGLARRRPNMTN